MASSVEAIVFRAAAAGARPDPALTVSEWADEHRKLTSRSASEPGDWRTARTPYLREIMDSLSARAQWERIVFMKASQLGCTEAMNNLIGYIIAKMPGPTMMVQPTGEMAKRNSKQRIDPLIADSPVLRNLVKEPRARDSSNTVFSKEFPGGILVMVGANSAAALRSMPARFVLLDEVDAYPMDVDGEGEPCELVMARARTFARRKIFIGSTPTISGRSRIEKFYEESDQCQFWVPCYHCRERITLRFEQLRWPKGRPEAAVHVCQACGKALENHHKNWMLPLGEWRPGATGDGKTRGFHLSSLYSPVGWFSWAEIAAQHDKATHDRELEKVFQNTVLGLPFSEIVEQPESEHLYERREKYRIGTVPRGGLVLTAGVDVQARRLECEIVAWGRRRESWSVDYRVWEGDTSQPEVWNNVTKLLDESFPTAYGMPLQIEKIGVDSGFNTQAVYEWARSLMSHRVMVLKGDARSSHIVGQPSPIEVGPQGQRIRYGMRLWPVNSSMAKEELYRWLRQPVPNLEANELYPNGFCHFPEYSQEYFAQLCAEQLVTKFKRGFRHSEWHCVRHRNEALDCRIYSRAAVAALRVELWPETKWAQIEESLTPRRLEEKPAATVRTATTEKGKMPVFKPFGTEDPYL